MQKHLNLNERSTIEQSLNDCLSFKAIGRELNRNCTTISKEVRLHRIFKKTGSFGNPFNNCVHRYDCDKRLICDVCVAERKIYCRFCRRCISNCKLYKPEVCPLLSRPPYVCNGCEKLTRCTLEKAFYNALPAQKEYKEILSESRAGISITEKEAARLEQIISPLIRKGQSIHHICTKNKDSIMYSEKTIYNYVGYNIFSARNIDLPRKVRYRPRKVKRNFKVDKACRIKRTYENFLAYMAEHPDTPVVQMDSVEGEKGGKVLLTLLFLEADVMLAFLRDANDSKSVIDVFDRLYIELGPDVFTKLFPVILCDNGSEFSNPKAIEYDGQGNRRTRIFYCDPSSPYQKGALENNHEFIRRILPKGNGFDSYCQADISLMMDHINSYGRKKLGDKSPYETFEFIHGNDFLNKLGCRHIDPKDITLQPSLLKKR
ncbi:MAG: IS30 family transposase [Fermentimonas caenicola]|nr:MAG: IS30 family transposase [Fermentimonas caenicola]